MRRLLTASAIVIAALAIPFDSPEIRLADANLVTTLQPREAIRTIYPGPGGEVDLDFRFTTFNGLPLGGPTVSSTSPGTFGTGFASDTSGSLLTAGSIAWPEFQDVGPSGWMADNGTFGPNGLQYYGPQQTGDPSVAWAENSVDERGASFEFKLPESGYPIGGGGAPRLSLSDPSTVRFVSVPERAILPRLPKVLPRLFNLGIEARVTRSLQRATTLIAATVLWAPYNGIEIYLPRVTVAVMGPCSGYHTVLLMLGVAGLLVAVHREKRVLLATVLGVTAIAVGLEANALRVAGTAVVLNHLGWITDEGKTWLQFATSGLAMAQLAGLGRLVSKRASVTPASTVLGPQATVGA
jgi:exosortase/archaeosortase family protein